MESNGTLPSSEEIRFATICGSHANMAARAIMHGSMVHDIPNEWRRAIQDGAEWKVIKAVVWQQFPELVDMVCQSGNTNQSISKQEDEMQLLNKIRQACKAYGGSGAPKWQDVAGAALRSRPKCGPSGPAIFGFVVRFGGSSKLLADTQAYVRACGKGGRELGQETWATLSQEMKNFPDHLRWRHALLKYGFAGDTTLTVTDAARKQFISVCTHTCIIYIYQLSLLSTSLQVGRVARLLFLVEDLIAYNNVRFTTSAEICFNEFRMGNSKDICDSYKQFKMHSPDIRGQTSDDKQGGSAKGTLRHETAGPVDHIDQSLRQR